MKETAKKLLGCLVTLALTVSLVSYLGRLVRPVDTDDAVQAINTFHALPENSVEVLGLGSSHIWHGLDMSVMYAEYGIGAYNYGCNWQKLNTTTLFLEDALRTQSPKVVLIETFNVNAILENTDINGEIYYTTAIPEFEGKQEYLRQCFGRDPERYLSYYMPLCAFHDNWVNLSKKSFNPNPNNDRFVDTMGFLRLETVEPIQVGDPATFPQQELSARAVAELDKIVSLCRARGIEILFYTAPYGDVYPYGQAMARYAAENGCGYIDFFEVFDQTGIDPETDFRDFGHLNADGAVKAAAYLGKYLAENYDLTDLRQVEGNPWENKDWFYDRLK